MSQEITIQKRTIADFNNDLRFLRKKPTFLKGTALYCEEWHHLRFAFFANNKLIEKRVRWEDVRESKVNFIKAQINEVTK